MVRFPYETDLELQLARAIKSNDLKKINELLITKKQIQELHVLEAQEEKLKAEQHQIMMQE